MVYVLYIILMSYVICNNYYYIICYIYRYVNLLCVSAPMGPAVRPGTSTLLHRHFYTYTTLLHRHFYTYTTLLHRHFYDRHFYTAVRPSTSTRILHFYIGTNGPGSPSRQGGRAARLLAAAGGGYMYIYIYIYMYICSHICTHTYIHIGGERRAFMITTTTTTTTTTTMSILVSMLTIIIIISISSSSSSSSSSCSSSSSSSSSSSWRLRAGRRARSI